MTRPRTIAIAALSAALLAGGGAGLALASPSVAGAAPSTALAHHPSHGRMAPGMALRTVASMLGTSVREVRLSLRAGTSIAAQAEAAGVPLASIVDALVAELSQRLDAQVERGRLTRERADQVLAEAPDRIAAALERSRPAATLRGRPLRPQR
jgi:hypothetical protein